MKFRIKAMCSTAMLAFLMSAGSAFAQENSGDEGASNDEGRGNEIIVTARLKEESIQDIGQSIAAFDQDAIERAGIEDFSDIARRTAGLDFNDRGPNANEVSIRGVSKLINQTTLDILPGQPLVAQFVDDIPVSSPNSRQRDFNLFDFGRVEILRGPQPTYFGEGSVGGTIRYFSSDPSLDGGVSGKLAAGVSTTSGAGDLNYELNGSLDLTLVEDRLGVRVSGFQRDDSGFIDNTLIGVQDVNDFETWGGRIVVLAEPVDNLTIRGAVHIARDEIGDDWIADSRDTPLQASFNPILNDTRDDYELYSLKIAYDLGPIEITSVTGWYNREVRRNVYDAVQSLNSLPATFGITGTLVTNNFIADQNFTQELRIVSDLGGPFNFTAGFFYKDSETTQAAVSRSDDLAAISLTGNDLFFGTEDAFGVGNVREQTALFFEGNLEPVEGLRIIAGVRWLDETLTSPTGLGTAGADTPALATCIGTPTGIPNFPNPGDNAVIFGVNPCTLTTLLSTNQILGSIPGASDLTNLVNEVDGFLPKFAVEYAVTDDMLLYASAAKGVRNGGVNSAFVVLFAPEVPIDSSGLTFGQDEVWAYELGLKSAWLDGDLIVNVGAFYNDWSDIQVSQATSAGALFVNAPSARTMGAELEASWQVSSAVSLFFAGNYTSAEFTEDLVLATPEAAALNALLGIPTQEIVDGNRLPNVPEFTISTGADLRTPIGVVNGKNVDLIGRIDYQYTDSRPTDIANTPAFDLEGFGLVNLRLGVGGDNWELSAYVNNLTNEIANQSFFQAGVVGFNQINPVFVNRPRTIGLISRFDF